MSTSDAPGADRDSDAPKTSLVHFFGWSLRQSWRSWGLSSVVLVTLGVLVLAEVAVPLGLQIVLDDVIPHQDASLLLLVASFLVGFVALQALAGVLHDWSLATIGARVLARTRSELFVHLQTQPADFYATRDASEILSRFGGDLRELELTATTTLPQLMHNTVSLVVSLGILFSIDWRLTLATTVLLALSVVAPGPILTRSFAAEHKRQEANESVLEVIEENIATHRVIRVFQLQKRRLSHLSHRLSQLQHDTVQAGLWSGLVGRVAGTLVTLVEVGVTAGGAWLVITGELTVGLLVAFLHLFLNAAFSLRGMLSLAPMATRGASNLARVEALLDLAPGIQDVDTAISAQPLQEAIILRNVSYAYENGHLALDDVSLTIAAGQHVAFVGGSGSGKSTLLSVISRLRVPTKGVVAMDGHNLGELTEASLRQQSSFVLQEPYLFDASIRENVRVGNLEADEQQIVRALELAGAAEFVRKLPDGMDTRITRGGGLSGGQKQRVAIARALVRNPRILYLDEATSALDPATEHAINCTLEQVTRGQTVVSVTHRLHSAVGCDQIFVLESGRLVESGTHQQLIERGGVYSDLWTKQSGFSVSPEGDVASVDPERLLRIPLFAAFESQSLAELTNALVPERFQAGQEIVQQGGEGDRFYLIARGTVEAVQTTDVSERVLRVMGDGDYFGEIAIVERVPRTATVRARTQTVCLSLSHDAFSRLLADQPELRKNIESSILSRRAHSERTGSEPLPSP